MSARSFPSEPPKKETSNDWVERWLKQTVQAKCERRIRRTIEKHRKVYHGITSSPQ